MAQFGILNYRNHTLGKARLWGENENMNSRKTLLKLLGSGPGGPVAVDDSGGIWHQILAIAIGFAIGTE